MPRPRKWRRVCCMPNSQSFGPLDGQAGARIVMGIDEFETIRLIDLEGLSQEECAQRMGVARTTAQAIYSSARAKLAECLVKGMELSINGGDYILCDGESRGCGCGRCHRRCGAQGGANQEISEDAAESDDMRIESGGSIRPATGTGKEADNENSGAL